MFDEWGAGEQLVESDIYKSRRISDLGKSAVM